MRRHCLALLCLAGTAQAAEFGISGGAEHFLWREYDLRGGRLLDEAGLRRFVELDYRHAPSRSTQATYTARFYGGEVDYTGGLLSGEPYTTTTAYLGRSFEALLFVGSDSGWGVRGRKGGLVLGIGLDAWSRDLEGPYGYREEYETLFVRLGLSESAADGRWRFDLGVKKPVWVDEDVHLCDGVRLEPEPAMSLFWDIAYRLSAAWALNLYYDSFRFEHSPSSKEPITCNGVLTDINGDGWVPDYVFQPESKADSYGVSLRYRF